MLEQCCHFDLTAQFGNLSPLWPPCGCPLKLLLHIITRLVQKNQQPSGCHKARPVILGRLRAGSGLPVFVQEGRQIRLELVLVLGIAPGSYFGYRVGCHGVVALADGLHFCCAGYCHEPILQGDKLTAALRFPSRRLCVRREGLWDESVRYLPKAWCTSGVTHYNACTKSNVCSRCLEKRRSAITPHTVQSCT